MKPAQTVGLLVLAAVMVFAVTFASMYVAPSRPGSAPKKKKQDSTPGLQLTFPTRRFPEGEDFRNPMKRVVTEYEKTGQHDFWFNNPNDEDVRVGLSTTCTCSGLHLFVAPEAWRVPVDVDDGNRFE